VQAPVKVYYKEQTKHNLFREEALKTKEGELLHEAIKRYKGRQSATFSFTKMLISF